MTTRATSRLALISGAQLVCGVAGMVLGVRRRHAFHFLFLRGDPANVPRDSVLLGTALSAPVVMLTTQAVATASLVRNPGSGTARRTLGGLGAMMIGGYLGEELIRHRLTRHGWDGVESPLLVAGLLLTVGMAVDGLGRSAGTSV